MKGFLKEFITPVIKVIEKKNSKNTISF